MKSLRAGIGSAAFIGIFCIVRGAPAPEFAWPRAESDQKPWTYWWWMGSAVDPENLTVLLTRYRDAGFGGVHIIPIYGVKGCEERYLPYLGDEWMRALAHTVAEARRLGLGVDMTTGTGWPFGGPQVGAAEAAKKLVLKRFGASGGTEVRERLEGGAVQAVTAYADDGRVIDLTDRVDGEGVLTWSAPPGTWDVYAALSAGTGQRVKRAAPGAEGPVVDPYSKAALGRYLGRFDEAFAAYRGGAPRAHYHDSFEYFGASWTPGLFDAFSARRGYDLRRELRALAGGGPEDRVARVKADYRATIADCLLEEFIEPWVAWCRERGSLTRNQAHGSPGNLLDLYAASDIPETEIFGPSGFPIPGLRTDPDFRNEPPDPLMLAFSSSAAHVAGRSRVASETCTWLGEHFRVALSQVKPELDQLFAAGINHIVYHGIAYSPLDAAWPGWLFYASTNFAPSNPFWRDLPALNAYAARCQAVLQSGMPANDILLYFPAADVWHDPAGLVRNLSVHAIDAWLHGTPFHETAKKLSERGYTFDYISDRLLARSQWREGFIRAAGAPYRAVLVPACRHMPVATAEKLLELARAGATIIMSGELPADVPGWGDLDRRRAAFGEVWKEVREQRSEDEPVDRIRVGSGTVAVGGDLEAPLAAAGVQREPIADSGVRFIRRTHAEGYHYFLANLTARDAEGWVPLATEARSVVIMDPLGTDRTGLGALRRDESGRTRVYLQLRSGGSLVLRTFAERRVTGPAWPYRMPAQGDGAARLAVAAPWRVTFVEGGPELPSGFTAATFVSWTELGDEEAKRFAGTARYETSFELPPGEAADWILDLGDVRESAQVWINGQSAGTLWSLPFAVPVGRFLKAGTNELAVEVTNLGANRIADLDRRGVAWRRFHDINFVDIRYRPFDASKWPPQPSGLLGPVRLEAVRVVPHDELPAKAVEGGR